MVERAFLSTLGTKMTATFNKRLRVLRHRTARWFLPPPGRHATDDQQASEVEREVENQARTTRQEPHVKRLRPLK